MENNIKKRVRNFVIVVSAIITAIVILEISLRKLLDFPLFYADNEIGYYPKPSQSGSFLIKNDWVFNSISMGVAREFETTDKFDVVLVGDSVVYGGNPLRQIEKLGPTLERETGWSIWPVAAGSWALQNELAYFQKFPKVAKDADAIVFLVNSGDFSEPSSWSSQITHPRDRPKSYILFTLAKFFGGEPPAPSPELKVRPVSDLSSKWRSFVAATAAPIIVVAYPSQVEISAKCEWLPAWIKASTRWTCYGQEGGLASSAYRDAIHPSVQGNQLLSEFIEESVSASRRAEQ